MKILYIMHINWYWIRQRPHILAEKLSNLHDVKLLHFAMYHRRHKSDEDSPPFPDKLIYRVPGRIKRLGKFFELFDALYVSYQIRKEIQSFQPDLIWVTHPDFERAISCSKVKVVYDCMDDHLAFDVDASEALSLSEQRLLARANLTIFSSETLARRVTNRSHISKSIIVNNGVSESLLKKAKVKIEPKKSFKKDMHNLGYYGTISHWFDWDLVLKVLEELPNTVLNLAGPIETSLPKHPRVNYVGVLPHAKIPSFVEKCNILIMPFCVTPLIEAVDPVKLYEYISFDLPCLAPRYSESERFTPWVSLYDNKDDAIELIKANFSQHSLSPPYERLSFLGSNSWDSRYSQIEKAIKF